MELTEVVASQNQMSKAGCSPSTPVSRTVLWNISHCNHLQSNANVVSVLYFHRRRCFYCGFKGGSGTSLEMRRQTRTGIVSTQQILSVLIFLSLLGMSVPLSRTDRQPLGSHDPPAATCGGDRRKISSTHLRGRAGMECASDVNRPAANRSAAHSGGITKLTNQKDARLTSAHQVKEGKM